MCKVDYHKKWLFCLSFFCGSFGSLSLFLFLSGTQIGLKSFWFVNVISSFPNIDGVKYLKINYTYQVSLYKNITHQDSLLDKGANSGVCGSDMTIIDHTNQFINLRGLDNHEVIKLEIVSCASVTESQKGLVVFIFHQYANYGKGKSIHSSG